MSLQPNGLPSFSSIDLGSRPIENANNSSGGTSLTTKFLASYLNPIPDQKRNVDQGKSKQGLLSLIGFGSDATTEQSTTGYELTFGRVAGIGAVAIFGLVVFAFLARRS